MLPDRGRPVVFVGGKGGVGKTTTASALALRLAGRGERTLLVSTDPAHSLSDLFDRRIGDDETGIVRGLRALEIDPDREVERYLGSVKKTLRELVRPAMYDDIESQIELTRRSPGAREAALLERLSRILIEAPRTYDRVIFDTAPTGQTLRLLTLPEVMTAWMEGLLERRERSESFRESLRGVWSKGPERDDEAASGRGGRDAGGAAADADDDRAGRIRRILDDRRRRFSRARRILRDGERCAFLLVVLPEKLPVLEADRAFRTLGEAGIHVTCLIVNRVLPDRDLGRFLERRREQEAAYLAEIERRFGDLPRIRIPLLDEDVGGLDGLRTVAEHLGAD